MWGDEFQGLVVDGAGCLRFSIQTRGGRAKGLTAQYLCFPNVEAELHQLVQILQCDERHFHQARGDFLLHLRLMQPSLATLMADVKMCSITFRCNLFVALLLFGASRKQGLLI
jgi:hypothetical protein